MTDFVEIAGTAPAGAMSVIKQFAPFSALISAATGATGAQAIETISNITQPNFADTRWYLVNAKSVVEFVGKIEYGFEWKVLPAVKYFTLSAQDFNGSSHTYLYKHASKTPNDDDPQEFVLRHEYEFASLMRVLFVTSAKLTGKDIREGIVSLSKLLNKEQFSTVDAILETVPAQDMSIEMMITLLRTSFMARDRMPNWRIFLGRAKSEVVRRGRDAEDIFQGLF